MQAVLSGRAAVAFINDGAHWHSIHYDEIDQLVPRQPHEFDLLFQGVRDLDHLDEVTVDEVKDRLTDAVDSSEGLDLVLYLLDARLSDATRDSAAREFEELAVYPEIVEQIEHILLAAPMPDSADFEGALDACERTQCGVTESLLDEWQALQPAVRNVFQAWHAIPLDRFGSPDGRKLAHAVCLRHGLFREMARGLSHPSQLVSVQMTRSRDTKLKRELPGIVGLLNDWFAPLKSSAQTARHDQPDEEEWDENEVDSPKQKARRSFDRTAALDKVNRKKSMIVAAMRDYNLSKTERLIDELVEFQSKHGGHRYTCQSLCDLAKQADALGLYPLQLRLTSQAVELVPDDGWSWGQHGKALLEMNRQEEALRAYDRSLEFKENVVAKTGRAEVLKALGRLEAALTAYEEVCREHPEDVVAKNGRAEVLKALGRLEAALTAYEEVCREHPENVVAKTGRAEVLKALGRLEAALTAYEEVCREHPEDVVAKTGRAEVLKALGRLEAALTAYEEVCREHPEDVVAKNGRAEALKALGRLEAALTAYEEVCREHPENVVAKTGRASVLVAMKRWDDALQDLPDGDPQTRNDWITAHIRGMIFLRRGQLGEAEMLMRRGLEKSPFVDNKPFFATGLALVQLRQGKLKEARTVVEDLCESGLKGPVEALLTEINGRDHQFDAAAKNFAQLPDTRDNIALAETFAELKRRYVDQLPAQHDDEWLLDRQIAYLLCA